MKLKAKRIILAVSGIALLGGGWFVWETQMNMTPQTLSIPTAEAAINPAPSDFSNTSADVLIDKVIVLSGLQKQIDQVSEELLKDMHHYPEKPDDPMIIAELEKIVMEVYKPEFFYERIHQTIKQNLNREYLETLVKMYDTPLMRKITAIENRDFDFLAFEAFIEGVIRTSLPPNRLQLLQELESVTRTTEFAVELSISTRRAMLMGASGDNADALSTFDATISAQQDEIRENTYQTVLLVFAYSYQELTDSELNEYIHFYYTEEGEWFITQTINAFIEAFHASSLQTGKRIAELALQKKMKVDTSKVDLLLKDTGAPLNRAVGEKTVNLPADTAEEWEADTVASDDAQHDVSPKTITARSFHDARECLSLTGNQAIANCAEHFR